MSETESDLAWEFVRYWYHKQDCGMSDAGYPLALAFIQSQANFYQPQALVEKIKNSCRRVQEGPHPLISAHESLIKLLLLAIHNYDVSHSSSENDHH